MLIGGLGTALLFVSIGATSSNSENTSPVTFDESMIITLDELKDYESYRLGGAAVFEGDFYQVVEIESTLTIQGIEIKFPFRLIKCQSRAN